MKRLAAMLTLAAAAMLAATEYHVSPEGDDRADGSARTPWKTLAKVNAELKPGDSATFLPGRYPGCISPAASGAKDRPIVYRSRLPGQAVITGGEGRDGGNPAQGAVFLTGGKYIEIDGFAFAVAPKASWMRITDAEFIRVRNSSFDGCEIYNPIDCRNVRYSRFENLRFTRGLNTHNGFVHCDMWNNYRSSYNVYDGFHISRFGHRPLGFAPDCPYNVVRNSIFDCRWGRNFEFFSTPFILMEKCFVTNSYDGSGSADGRSKIFFQNSIFRRNVMFRNWAAPLVFNSYKDSYQHDMIHVLKNNRFYFNTFYRNQDAGIELYEYWGKDVNYPTLVDNKFVNNIFTESNLDGDRLAFLVDGSRELDRSNLIYRNLLSGSADDFVFKFGKPEGLVLTLAEAEKKYPGQIFDNLAFDPGFVDPARDDFRLKAGSRAIDAGIPLARTVEAATGKVIKVSDAAFFYDGFGIPGETGDELMIGPGRQLARVTGRDLKENTLHLDREVTVAKGDAVTLRYEGKAPDLGAYESGGANNPGPIPVELRIPTMATASEVLVETDFEPENREVWFFRWNYSRQQNSSAEADFSGGANGSKGCYRVYATADNSILSTYIMPPEWDLARFPVVSFDYRIPAGVPVGIAVSPFLRKDINEVNLFLGGSPGYRANGRDLKLFTLSADGEWHHARLDLGVLQKTFPQLKYLKRFRFRTDGNGKKGDCFQLDNFRIEPK